MKAVKYTVGYTFSIHRTIHDSRGSMDDRIYFQRSDGDTEYDSNLRIKWSSDQGDKDFFEKKETFILNS